MDLSDEALEDLLAGLPFEYADGDEVDGAVFGDHHDEDAAILPSSAAAAHVDAANEAATGPGGRAMSGLLPGTTGNGGGPVVIHTPSTAGHASGSAFGLHADRGQGGSSTASGTAERGGGGGGGGGGGFPTPDGNLKTAKVRVANAPSCRRASAQRCKGATLFHVVLLFGAGYCP